MAEPFREPDVTHVLGIEARGFILGGAVATSLGRRVRPGPEAGQAALGAGAPKPTTWSTARTRWSATGTALPAPARVLVVDDVLATGGTARAAGQLARGLGAERGRAGASCSRSPGWAARRS